MGIFSMTSVQNISYTTCNLSYIKNFLLEHLFCSQTRGFMTESQALHFKGHTHQYCLSLIKELDYIIYLLIFKEPIIKRAIGFLSQTFKTFHFAVTCFVPYTSLPGSVCKISYHLNNLEQTTLTYVFLPVKRGLLEYQFHRVIVRVKYDNYIVIQHDDFMLECAIIYI